MAVAKISVSKAWDQTTAFIGRERRLVSPVVLALVFLPTLLFRVFAPQPSFAEMMAGNYPAWLPWLSYGLLFVQLIGGASLILMALGSRDAVGGTIIAGFFRAVVIVLAMLIGSLLAVPILVVLMIVGGIGGGLPTDPSAISPSFLLIALVVCVAFVLLVLRMILFIPAAVAERVGPWAALRRGWQLGRGNGGRLIATMLLLFIGAMVLNYAATAVVGTAARLALGSDQGTSIGGILVALIVAAIGSAIFLVQYVLLANLYQQAASGAPATGAPAA